MSKTYNLTATLNTGRLRNSDWVSDSWTKFFYNSDDPVGYSGYDDPRYYATNIMFDQSTLASLRSKVSNGITVSALTLEVNCVQAMTGETYIAYKYNSTASGTSSSNAWARSTNADNAFIDETENSLAYTIPAQSLSTGTQTFNLKRTTPFSGIPKYGLVAGPRRLVSGRWRFTSAILHVTTNETDYSYTLAYNVNGGSGTFSNQTGSNTGTSPSYTFTISSTVPTRAGYTFLGWSTSSSATSASYSPGGSITVTSSGTTTLYAVWKIITYTVSYNVNGGSGSFANQTKNYGGSFNIHSAKPTKSPTSAGSYTVTYNGNGGSPGEASKSAARTTSYTFSTWNTAQNGSGASYAAGATYSANASATLYAQYTSSTTTASIALTTATRTGYNFNGWYTAASGGTRVGGAGSAYTPTGNVTLYAQWTASSATLSSVSPTTIDCGGTLTGNWTSTGQYYYWLKVTCGNGVGRWSSSSASGTGSLSLTVQIPTEWYTMTDGPMRDSDRATATCTLYTYSDSAGTVLVGTPSSLTFTAKVPTSVVPTLSTLSAASSSDNAVVSDWGSTVFVQGYSKVTLTQSVSSYNGSRFSSVRYSGLGLDSTKTGSLASSDPSSVINSAGTFTYTATVTDTRGRSASKTVSVTFQPYAQPSIAGIAVQRCDSDGTVNNSTGDHFKATPVYSFSSVTVSGTAKNALMTQNIKYRVHPNGAWSTATTCASGSTYGPWSALLTNSYDVMVTLADRIQNGSSQTTTFTTTLPTVQGIWYGKSNDRLGLGGVPEGAGLYCDWDATFKGVVDVVPRRCSAWLSSAGWYRVMKLTGSNIYEAEGAGGFIVDFNITRNVDTANNDAHKISLMATWGNFKFINEQSVSNALGITKIRTTNSGSNLYVDVYYGLSTGNTVTISFNVTCLGGDEGKFNSQPFTSVDPSPSGETVLTEYTFVANTGARVVHAQASTSFWDAIETIKNIVGDSNLTWGGIAAGNLQAGISNFSNGVVSVSSSGGPDFFATLGKLNNSYYAAELFTYNYPWRIRIRNTNGTYHAELYYPNY